MRRSLLIAVFTVLASGMAWSAESVVGVYVRTDRSDCWIHLKPQGRYDASYTFAPSAGSPDVGAGRYEVNGQTITFYGEYGIDMKGKMYRGIIKGNSITVSFDYYSADKYINKKPASKAKKAPTKKAPTKKAPTKKAPTKR